MSQPNEPKVMKIVSGKVKFSTIDEVAKWSMSQVWGTLH